MKIDAPYNPITPGWLRWSPYVMLVGIVACVIAAAYERGTIILELQECRVALEAADARD